MTDRAEPDRRPTPSDLAAARDLCAFVDTSPTPFHAVRTVALRLDAGGFTELREVEPWALAPGGRYYVVRGDSTIVAFVVGDDAPARGGFAVVGAHTDSPNLRVKPHADVVQKGYRQLGVEVYGGVLLSTWLDRDLSLAGRVFVRSPTGPVARLVDFGRIVGRVPNLAIHLNRNVNAEGLVLNAQRHLAPVVGFESPHTLDRLLGDLLEVGEGAVLGYDLCFYDVQKAALGGTGDEFVHAARLDNLASCHAATNALLRAAPRHARTRAIVLYDHEECGSRSAVGAAGTVLKDTLARIVEAHPRAEPQALPRALAGSFLVSADMAHAVHPNYPDLHEPHHQPRPNHGLVLKTNANQSYATNGATQARFEAACAGAGHPAQRFVVRSDLPCGSTIGPITAAALGIPTVDCGAPMLSMHSCREMAGTKDVAIAAEVYRRLLDD